MRYGILIDLNTCAGCNSCTYACKIENGTLHGVYWRVVIVKEEGKYPNAKKKVLPMACMHCEDAPCVNVCPTGGSHHDEYGLVQIDHTKCVGCTLCIGACPYGVRSYNECKAENNPYFGDDFEMTPFERFKAAKHPVGKVEKCIMCKDRIMEGKEPACVMACITKCMCFGDIEDPESEISKKIKELNAKPYCEDFGTKPSVYYAGTF